LSHEITVEAVSPLTLAAVQVVTPVNRIGVVWKPALDKVWAFLRENPRVGAGKNVFLYHHPECREHAMAIDFGVQVSRRFADGGEIVCVETPAGEVAQTVHVGPYDGLKEAHDAIHAWCNANNRRIAGASWEIYGHWNSDPAKLETVVQYLLR
jgi:effector-binding domain-containing protein